MRQFVAPLMLIAGCSAGDVTPAPMCPTGKCAVVNSFLAAQVTPVTPATGNAILPTQEVAQVFIDNDNHFTLMLERAITLGGTLTDAATGANVAATVVLSRPSHIAGQPNVVYTTRAGDSGDWSVVVSPTHDGEYYTVRVQPDETAKRPPEVFLIDGSHDRTLKLQLSDPTALLQVHGTITNALQAPIAGMQVQAHDPVSDALVSSTAVTDAQGSFALKVALASTPLAGNPSPAMALASVKLVATPPQTPSPGMWLPRLEQALDVTHAALNTLTVNLALPALPNAAQLVYNVVGVSTSGKQTQVAAAHCQFTADVSDPKSETHAFYDVAADTDATGNASVMLIPASDVNRAYQVAVSPPSSSEFQAQTSMLSVGPSGGYGGSILLPLRSQVTGTVLGPDGAPVKTLTVIPHPATLAEVLAPAQSTLSKLSDALTDASGSFVLRVDNGSYDLELVPIAASMLPHWWIAGQVVGGDVDLQPVTMPPATPVVGQVTDAAGMLLVGADVQLYQVPSGNASCATADYACLAPPRVIAEGTVGKDGSLSVLLPGTAN